jgi:hypothetical protein
MRKYGITVWLLVFVLTLLFLNVRQHWQLKSLSRSESSLKVDAASCRKSDASGLSDKKLEDYENTIRQLKSQLEQKQRTIDEMRLNYEKAIKQPVSQLAETNRVTSERQVDLGKQPPQPKTQPEGAETITNAPKDETPLSGESPTPLPDSGSLMSSIVEMMKNPAMKQSMSTRRKATLEVSYKSLFEDLDLSGEDLESFKELLLKKETTLIDKSLEMMDSLMTPDRKKEARESIDKLTAELNKEIEAFLSEEGYAIYEEFEKTQAEREIVNLLKQSLSGIDQLGKQQEKELISTMYETRSTFESTTDYKDGEKIDPSKLSPEYIAKQQERTAKLHEQYLLRAGEILTPEQLKQFKASLEHQRMMQEMAMQFATKMFSKQRTKIKPSESKSE